MNKQYGNLTFLDWVAVLLLLMVPIVNVVLLCYWSFAGGVNPSKKTFAQASLVIIVVGTILCSIVYAGAAALFVGLIKAIFSLRG